MTKLEHSRPFNLEHASAGAPIAMLNGWPFEIFKWDSKLPGFPIVGMCGEGNTLRQASWTATGGYGIAGTSTFDLVMTPLGFVDGKPVFVGDELVDSSGGIFAATPSDIFGLANSLRWPAPAKVYPETRMDPGELHAIYLNHQSPTYYAGFAAIANAALRHAIDHGYMPTKEAYDLCSRDLGKAERLLESLGYRSAGNGEWTPPAPQEIPTEDLLLYNLRALEKSGRNTGEHAAVIRAFRSAVNDVPHARAARDTAIAEAVLQEFLSVIDPTLIDLPAVIAKVPS